MCSTYIKKLWIDFDGVLCADIYDMLRNLNSERKKKWDASYVGYFFAGRMQIIGKRKREVVPKQFTCLLISTFQIQLPVDYRVPDIESKQSVLLEQTTTPLQGYTHPYTGGKSPPPPPSVVVDSYAEE